MKFGGIFLSKSLKNHHSVYGCLLYKLIPKVSILSFIICHDNTLAQLNDVLKQKIRKGMSILIQPTFSSAELYAKIDRETYEVTITSLLNVPHFGANT